MIFLQKFASLGIWGILVSVIIGAVLTALVHSSSAITAIVITLATLNADCFPWSSLPPRGVWYMIPTPFTFKQAGAFGKTKAPAFLLAASPV